MSRRNLRFAMMMALSLPAQLPMVASAQPRNRIGPKAEVDPMQKWANSGYGYCDAKILGALWGTDTYEAKRPSAASSAGATPATCKRSCSVRARPRNVAPASPAPTTKPASASPTPRPWAACGASIRAKPRP